MMKICKECKKEQDIECFERAYPKDNPSDLRRTTCRDCRGLYHEEYRNANRGLLHARDRDIYWSLSPEDRQIHIDKKSKQNSQRKGISESRKKYNQSDIGKYTSYRHDAMRRNRNYEWKLTLEEFSEIFHQNCHYCNKIDARGIDRVNNDVGYIASNCVGCCKKCNAMKMTDSAEAFIDQCRKIVAKFDKKGL